VVVVAGGRGEVGGADDGVGDEALVDVLEGHVQAPAREGRDGDGGALVLLLCVCVFFWGGGLDVCSGVCFLSSGPEEEGASGI
jgi:hypothetical protein